MDGAGPGDAPAVLRHEADGIATLTLNRPEKRNALNLAIFQSLDAAVADLEARTDEVGVVVLRGAGACFSAGADISAPSQPPRINYQASVIERLANLPQPVVVAVHGHCVTGGLELALAGDLLVAAESARFADTHGRLGLVAAWGMTQRLPRRVGMQRAREMMFTGRMYSGREAERIGLAVSCVADDDLDDAVREIAGRIAAASWFSHRQHKRVLQQTDGATLSDGLAYEFYRVDSRVGPEFPDRASGRFGRTGSVVASSTADTRE